jgi:rubrerythrin
VSQQTLHRAWRYLIYIRELGAEPVAYEGGKHRAYAAALEQQYARLSRAAMATDVRAAKARAVGLIKRKGLMRAAGIADPNRISPSTAKLARVSDPAQPKMAEFQEQPAFENAAVVQGPAKPTKSEIWNCRRKIRHQNYLTAIWHASRLEGPDVQIFPCRACGYAHVGHAPDSDQVRRYRKLRRRMRTIAQRIAELEREHRQLERERLSVSDELRQLGSASEGVWAREPPDPNLSPERRRIRGFKWQVLIDFVRRGLRHTAQ